MRAFGSRQEKGPQRTSSTTPPSPDHAPTKRQQENPLLSLQRKIGNQAVLRLLGAKPQEGGTAGGLNEEGLPRRTSLPFSSLAMIQPKLAINAPGDVYEQEAGRVADHVMRVAESQTAAAAVSRSGPAVQRQCACGGSCSDCQKEHRDDEHPQVLMKAAGPGSAGGIEAPPLVHDVLRSPGQPLDARTRSFMEPRFELDFSQVRVHTDSHAADSAKQIHARAYTVGDDVVFASSQFAPASSEGQKLLAHELTHVAQQGAGAKAIQRAPDHDDPSSAESLVDKYRQGFYSLLREQAYEGLASELFPHVRKHDYRFVREAFKHIPAKHEDNVAFALVDKLQISLDEAAATADGRAMLDVLYDALITGDVSKNEREQADRILKAKARNRAVPEGNAPAKTMKDPMVFPIKTQKILGDINATLHAKLLPSGKVKVSLIGRRHREFKEMKTLHPRYSFREIEEEGFDLDPDELVFVKLYDQSEATVPVSAIQLIDFANSQQEAFESQLKTVVILGATVGLGAVGGGGILGWADTITFAINVGSVFVQENRELIGRTAFGRDFLEVWNYAEGIANYYGWARLGVDGLRAVHSKVSPALKRWRGEAPPKGLSSAETETIRTVKEKTNKWLDAVEKAEAVEAGKFVEAHPPKQVKGKPGHRHADLEGGHEVIEVSGGMGCEFHSPSRTPVPCPVEWHNPQTEHVIDPKETLEKHGVHEGKPVDIRLAEAAKGRDFDVLEGQKYPTNQVPIRDRGGRLRRLDSYDPVKGEIISRKSLEASNGQIALTDEFDMIGHFQEFALKYPSGATIANTPAARKMLVNGKPLAGQRLTGKYILEVPAQRYRIPDRVKEEAVKRNITIRDINGKVY